MAQEWEKVFFTRNIPGCAFSLLLGNLYYAWQCGRLGNKENRTDVTAQPYGINTTGIYITLFAIQLEALFTGAFMFLPEATATEQEVQQAAANAADHAWKVSVACNFLLGIFEPLGMLGEGLGTQRVDGSMGVPNVMNSMALYQGLRAAYERSGSCWV